MTNKLDNRKNKDVVQPIFTKVKIEIKIKLLLGNSAITEGNELKNIYVTVFKFMF